MSYTIIPLAAPVVLPHVELPVVAFVARHDRDSGLPGVPATLPVTRSACGVCGEQLPASGPVGGPCRVHGDSRYGYEATHEGCDWANATIADPPPVLRCPDCGPMSRCVHM